MPRKRKPQAPRVVRCRTGCALCGELVDAPHWCVAKHWRAHEAFLAGNVRYREAMARNATDEAKAQGAETPRTGISDLCEWGDYHFARALNLATAFCDESAVRRAEQTIAKLSRMHRAELSWYYIHFGECQRERVRDAQAERSRRPYQRKQPREWLPSELAYLNLVKRIR